MNLWESFNSDLDIAIRLVVALVLAGVLGWEREAAGKAAGMRTHMLVGVAAAMFVGIGEIFMERYLPLEGEMAFDPLRIVEALVTGISFLGAGTIFMSKSGGGIQGLTTAASILATAGIGLLAGLERFALATAATLVLFLILQPFRKVEETVAKDAATEDASPK